MKYLLDLTSAVSMPKGSEWERTELREGILRREYKFSFCFLSFLYLCIVLFSL